MDKRLEKCWWFMIRNQMAIGKFISFVIWRQTKTYILQKIKLLVQQHDPTAKIYLYGSRVRGNARKDSDWDLVILLNKDKITSEIEQGITYPLYDLEFETGEIISPMVYSENEWKTKYRITPFYSNVMKEGVLLWPTINRKITSITASIEPKKPLFISREVELTNETKGLFIPTRQNHNVR